MDNTEYTIYRFWSIYDEDELHKLIKSTEKQFRGSPEYQIWLNDFTRRDICAITGLSRTADEADIEVHHYGRTLYEWTDIIANRMIDNELMINSHYIGLILSDIHLSSCVPYLPLCSTYHKMLHKQGEYQYMEAHPTAKNFVYSGDLAMADSIINQHIRILKSISNPSE